MPQITANGIALEYDIHGPETGEPILLIMGLGAQMTAWPLDLIHDLTARGYRVARYDNRDVGLSHKFEAHGAPDMTEVFKALMSGQKPPVPYFLSDMAADAAGMIDALGFGKAHIVGASMGGMIAQMLAAEHPHKVLSLTSIMSTTGNRDLPPAKPEAMARLTDRGPDPREDLEAFIEHGLAGARVMAGKGNPIDEDAQRQIIRDNFQRSFYPVGFLRQYAAIVGSGDRRAALATIKAPTVVIHGADDPLVPVEGGHDTAAVVPGAELHVLPGMGHNLPKGLISKIGDLIERAVARAKATA
ncbi:MAG: alpha/beta hydrolase [Phenylobacterium zucineum]|nr:MAG: alpha/beta hydrolase [Phenylobacterium zucineum]